jgi:monofunctional biosynthetic peptidoglycan transglycosylase
MKDNALTVTSKIGSAPDLPEPDRRVLGRSLFTFSGSEPAWYTVNDTVMGGISRSSVHIDPDSQKMTFSGNVSLENNGGFASTRSDWVDYDLRGYDGILMRVLGDGNTYRFRIRTARTGPEIAFTALFDTKAGTWHDVYIPFADVVPTYRGFVVDAAEEIDPSAIRSFGLMVADKQQGEFSLAVDWINAVAVKRNDYSNINFGAASEPAPSLVYASN